MSLRHLALSLLAVGACSSSGPPPAPVPAQPPIDVGFRTSTDSQSACVQRLITPYIQQARATYPQAKQRFMVGLSPGYHLALTTQLHDSTGHFEQVFIRVDSIVGGRVYGAINDDIYVVQGYHRGMHYTFNEAELFDWTITDPSGNEEGNVVGKFLDTFHGRPPC